MEKNQEQTFAEQQQQKHSAEYEAGQQQQKDSAAQRASQDTKKVVHKGADMNQPMHDSRMSNISQQEITRQHQQHQHEVRETAQQRQAPEQSQQESVSKEPNPAAERLAAKQRQAAEAGKGKEARPQDIERIKESQQKLADVREHNLSKGKGTEKTTEQSKNNELTR